MRPAQVRADFIKKLHREGQRPPAAPGSGVRLRGRPHGAGDTRGGARCAIFSIISLLKDRGGPKPSLCFLSPFQGQRLGLWQGACRHPARLAFPLLGIERALRPLRIPGFEASQGSQGRGVAFHRLRISLSVPATLPEAEPRLQACDAAHACAVLPRRDKHPQN